MSKLLHIKGSKVRVLDTFPAKNFGNDGEPGDEKREDTFDYDYGSISSILENGSQDKDQMIIFSVPLEVLDCRDTVNDQNPHQFLLHHLEMRILHFHHHIQYEYLIILSYHMVY